MSLVRVNDVTAADWIAARLAPFGSCVTAVVPAGFETYTRIHHADLDGGRVGELPAARLAALGELLARHTSTPDSCRFCLWEGYGWITEPPGPVVALPQRNYLFYRGSVADAGGLGWWLTPEHFVPQSPNLWWPQDRAWCVATEIDLSSTYVGGSAELAAALRNEPDAFPADPTDPIGAAAGH